MTIHRFTRILLLASVLVALSAASFAGVFVSVSIGPPPIPVYTQPLCPAPGYIWTPGYWAWGDDGYYWVPGTWVMAPQPGLLWTPGYWGWTNGAYVWNEGYWGLQVGFYGGINYGFGYGGYGYEGGAWRGNQFYYNRAVNNVNVTNVTNVYSKTVVVNNNSRVSYNGGTGGIRAQETAQQHQWRDERHVEATAAQRQQVQDASRNQQLLARNNGGKPAIAATMRPGDFKNVVAARSAGGRVDHAVLNATTKNIPKANATAAPAHASREVPNPATANTPRRAEPRSETAHNVPKPPNGTSSPSRMKADNARVTSPPSRSESAKPPVTETRRANTPHPTKPETSAESHPANPPHNAKPTDAQRSVRAPAPHAAPDRSAPTHASAPRPSNPSARESAPAKEANAKSAPRNESGRGEAAVKDNDNKHQ